jgi:hypothetical protein
MMGPDNDIMELEMKNRSGKHKLESHPGTEHPPVRWIAEQIMTAMACLEVGKPVYLFLQSSSS